MPKRALLVEDNRFVRNSLMEMFYRRHWDTVVAIDEAAKAIGLLEISSFTLVVADWTLATDPENNLIEFIKTKNKTNVVILLALIKNAPPLGTSQGIYYIQDPMDLADLVDDLSLQEKDDFPSNWPTSKN